MERWKKNDPSLRIGDSEEDAIIVSDDEEEVEASPSSGDSYQAPTLAERIGPVSSGQRAVHSSPGSAVVVPIVNCNPIKGIPGCYTRGDKQVGWSFHPAHRYYPSTGSKTGYQTGLGL